MLILFYILSTSLNCEVKFVNKEVKLMKVILSKETKKALEIINSNEEINLNEEIRGLSPFKASILNMDKELLEFLIQKGVDINGYDENGKPSFAILLDIIEGNLRERELNKVFEIFKLLLDKGVNLHLKFKDGSTILHYLVKHQKKEILEFLIKNKVNMNVTDSKHKSLLHTAVGIKGNNLTMLKILKILIPHTDINLQDKKGISALHVAVLMGNIEAVKLLLENKANINLKDLSHRTVLHYAAFKENLQIVKLLIESKADINALDERKNAPLHYAFLFSNFEVAKLLESNGADINIKNNLGSIPFAMQALIPVLILDSYDKYLDRINPQRYKSEDPKEVKELKDFISSMNITL